MSLGENMQTNLDLDEICILGLTLITLLHFVDSDVSSGVQFLHFMLIEQLSDLKSDYESLLAHDA